MVQLSWRKKKNSPHNELISVESSGTMKSYFPHNEYLNVILFSNLILIFVSFLILLLFCLKSELYVYEKLGLQI